MNQFLNIAIYYKDWRCWNHWATVHRLFPSDEGPMLETLDYSIRIGSTPTFLYFDFILHRLCLAVDKLGISPPKIDRLLLSRWRHELRCDIRYVEAFKDSKFKHHRDNPHSYISQHVTTKLLLISLLLFWQQNLWYKQRLLTKQLIRLPYKVVSWKFFSITGTIHTIRWIQLRSISDRCRFEKVFTLV